MKTVLIYFAAALAEIAGCFAFWAWLRLDKSVFWLVPGLLSLAAFAWLQSGDRIVALAYGRAYPEIASLFDRAVKMDLSRILVTAPGGALPDGRADVVLFVPRGQADAFSLHAGTLLALEALVLGYASLRRDAATAALDRLNAARRKLSGLGAGLPVARR